MRFALAVLMTLAATAALAETEITSLPFTASTNSETYLVDGTLSQTTSGASGGINVTGDDITIYGINGATVTNDAAAASISLNVSSGATGLEVYDITFSGGRVLLDVDAYMHDCTVSYGYTDEAAIRFTSATNGAIVENCKVLQTGASRSAIYARPTATNFRVESSLLISSSTYGVYLEGGTNGAIVNCSIDAAGTTSNAIRTDQSSGTLLLANNIIHGRSGSVIVSCTNAGWSGLTADQNNYWTGGTDVFTYGGTTYTTSTYTTVDAGGSLGDPLWTDDDQTLSGDYSLGGASSAIDAGDSTHVAVLLDLAGNDRIAGDDVDQGAYEQTATGACCTGASCVVVEESACTGGSEYQGNGTDCSPNPCVGACCYDESCVLQTETACDTGGGSYTGGGSVCSPNPCGLETTCDVVITEADLPYTLVGGTLCLDGGADRRFDYDARYQIVAQSSSPYTNIIPYHGTYGDTIYYAANSDGENGEFFLGVDGSPGFSVEGFVFGVADGLCANTFYVNCDSVVVDSCKGVWRYHSTGTSEPHYGTHITNSEIRSCPSGDSEVIFIATSPLETVTNWNYRYVLDNLDVYWHGIGGTDEDYAMAIRAIRDGRISNIRFHGTTDVGTNFGRANSSQATAAQMFSFRNTDIYNWTMRGDGFEQLFEIRSHTDAFGAPDTRSEHNRIWNIDAYNLGEAGNGVAVDSDSTRVWDIFAIAPGNFRGNAAAFRFSEQAEADTASNIVAIATAPQADRNGTAVRINGSDDWQVNHLYLENITAFSLGNDTGGNGAALDVGQGGDGPDSLTIVNSIFYRPQSGTAVTAAMANFKYAPEYVALQNTVIQDGLGRAWRVDGTNYTTDAEFEALYPEATNNVILTFAGGAELANATGDTLGDYRLAVGAVGYDYGDSTLSMGGRATDILGLDRIRGADIDVGAYETQPTGVTGACCDPISGACVVLVEIDCTSQGDIYQGDGTDCSPNPCDVPLGACCIVDGHDCVIETQAECGAREGSTSYRGDGTVCEPDPCPAFGACCTEDGDCFIRTQIVCVNGALNGQWTAEVDCDPNPCDQPGYCCLPGKGTCVEIAAWSCADQGGAAGAEGSDCDPDPCTASAGACCTDSGGGVYVCGQETEVDCSGMGGIFLGYIPCSPDPCAETTVGPRQRSAIWRILTEPR